jgi:2-hydroxychromene-2-carboxylate isomerase
MDPSHQTADGESPRKRMIVSSPGSRPSNAPRASGLPSLLLSARVVVISDFNCPYCFTLNEWLSDMGLAGAVRWVGVEHKPHLSRGLSATNRPDDLLILQREVADVSRRAPEVGVNLPPVWINSRRALLVQACLEDEQPQLAHRVRRELFRAFWHQGRDLSAEAVIESTLRETGMAAPAHDSLDPEELDLITAWWARELDRIPCMLAPTGARHLGLQDRLAVEAFVLGALRDRPEGDGCR